MNETKNQEERARMGARLADVRNSFEWVDDKGIKRVGITQKELADRTGIKQGNISRIEGGKYNVCFDTLTLLAEGLGRKIDIV